METPGRVEKRECRAIEIGLEKGLDCDVDCDVDCDRELTAAHHLCQ